MRPDGLKRRGDLGPKSHVSNPDQYCHPECGILLCCFVDASRSMVDETNSQVVLA